jgi:hypothetical protein
MYSYHGWAVLRESPREVDEGGLTAIVALVKQKLAALTDQGNPLGTLGSVNGAWHVMVSGFANRRSGEAQEMFDLFAEIARVAPGSYGLLYVWDDEDVEGYANVFRVWSLRRGQLTVHEDVLLSPCVPSIEDEVS